MTAARLIKAIFKVSAIIVLASIQAACSFVANPFSSSTVEPQWINIGATPSAENRFVPQGLAHINDHLYLAESHNDLKGYVYKLKVNGDSYKTVGQFLLPEDAVHTSGLTWDGSYLWAVDYISKKLYKIDLEQSVRQETAHVLAEYDTGLQGVSANAYFQMNNKGYMAISDFLNTKRTYIVPHGNYSDNEPIYKQAIFSVKNKWFSQGLEWAGKYLYEAGNIYGKDMIYQLDICKLFSTQNFDDSVTQKIRAPFDMVEDLAITDNGDFFTSDEKSFAIYRSKLEATAGRSSVACQLD